MSQIGAIQNIEDPLLPTADQQLRVCAAVVDQNSSSTRAHVGIISIKAELVVRRKPIRDAQATGCVELENAVAKSGATVPDTVSGEDVQADDVINGVGSRRSSR